MLSHQIDYRNIQPVSDERLALIDQSLSGVDVAIPSAMAYIRKIQGWSIHQLQQRLTGLSEVTLRSYLQPSYKKMRPLHFVAAYSWLTMMPMACFYRGLNVREAYPNLDDIAVESLIHSGLLPIAQFKLMIKHLYHYLPQSSQAVIADKFDTIQNDFSCLNDFEDKDFMFPKSVNIKGFAEDYYRSLALGCLKIRQTNNLSQQTMADALRLTLYRYQRLEDLDCPVSLPVELGARLQLCLGLDNAMYFTVNMQHYRAFNVARRVQHIRQSMLGEMMLYLDEKNKQYFSGMILNLASMYLQPQI